MYVSALALRSRYRVVQLQANTGIVTKIGSFVVPQGYGSQGKGTGIAGKGTSAGGAGRTMTGAGGVETVTCGPR